MTYIVNISLPDHIFETYDDMANIAHQDVELVIANILIEAQPDIASAVESLATLTDVYKRSKAKAGSGSAQCYVELCETCKTRHTKPLSSQMLGAFFVPKCGCKASFCPDKPVFSYT